MDGEFRPRDRVISTVTVDHRGNWRADGAGDTSTGDDLMDRPALYRIRDHALGGGHSFKVDRRLWQVFTDAYPMIESIVRETVSFRVRAVGHLAGLGVRQFVEIGSWLPTVWPTHTLVPQARVVTEYCATLTGRPCRTLENMSTTPFLLPPGSHRPQSTSGCEVNVHPWRSAHRRIRSRWRRRDRTLYTATIATSTADPAHSAPITPTSGSSTTGTAYRDAGDVHGCERVENGQDSPKRLQRPGDRGNADQEHEREQADDHSCRP